jgi:hypothetical protein
MLRVVHLFVWVYAWGWHALWTDPASLFDANVFHPAPAALAYSEHALGKLVTTGPLQALSGNPVLAYQVDLLLCFALSGAALYALVRALGGSRGAAFVAGFVYAFAPARIDTLYHTYLLAGQWFPLALLFLDRALFVGRTRDAAAFGVLLLLQLLTSYYLAYQTVFALVAYAVATLWVARARIPWRGLVRVALATSLVGAAFAAVSVPYLRVRSGGSILSYGSFAEGLLPLSNDAWKSYLLSPLLLRAGVGPEPTRGGYAYLGLATLVLAVAGLRGGATEGDARRRLRVAAIAIVLVCWVMALGPVLPLGDLSLPLPYALAMRVVPGFDSMRVPYRFALMMTFGVALLAGLGADRLLRPLAARRGRRAAALAAAGLVVVIALDYGFGLERFPTRPLAVGRDGPPVYAELARLPRGPLLELPVSAGDGLRASEYMVQSTTHWMPLLEGTSGYGPPSLGVVLQLVRRLPAPAALELLGRMTGLRYVVVHVDQLRPAERERWRDPAGLRRLGTFGADVLYEVASPPPADLVPALQRCARDVAACEPLKALLPG